MLLAHLDVVPRGEDSAYCSSVVDGRIYGPGSGDMKGELAILIEIFRAFHERYPGISLGMAVTSDEEIGGEHGTRFLFEKAGIRCGVAIVPDSGSLNEIAVEQKGILHLKIVARGSAGHASRPWLVDNPLERDCPGAQQISISLRELQRRRALASDLRDHGAANGKSCFEPDTFRRRSHLRYTVSSSVHRG